MRALLGALLIGILVGCAPPIPVPTRATPHPQNETEPSEPVIDRQVETGPLILDAKTPDLKPIWRAVAERGQLTVLEGGAMQGELASVRGELFQEGQPVTDFRAGEANGDQKSRTLTLRTGVTMVRRARSGKLQAEKVEWRPEAGRILASGGVRLEGDGYTLGPLPALLSTADLRRVGSPETFRDDPKMKPLLAPLLALSAAALAGTFADDQNNMSLNFRTWEANQVDARTLTFEATGSPAVGRWRAQNLSVRAQSIRGTAVRGATGGYTLTQSVFSGGVRATLAGQESISGRNVRRETVMSAGSVQFNGDADKGTVVSEGNVQFTSALSTQSQWMQLTATRAELQLTLKSGSAQPVQTADFRGPITLRMVSRSPAGETTDITGSARALSWSEGSREITLSGGVKITGKGPTLGGTMTADSVRIVLDEGGFVRRVTALGEPGITQLRENP